MKLTGSIITLISLLLTAPGFGETLDDAWTSALSSHQQIAAAGAMREAAGYELERARSARLPQLGLSSDYTMLDTAPAFAFGNGITGSPVFDGDDFVSATAQVRLPLYGGGAITAGIDAAEMGAEAADGQLATVIQDIKLGAAEHYVAVLRAERAVDVAESYVLSLTTHTEDTKNRFEFGDVPQNDYLAASVTLADAKQRLLQAENALDYSRAAYNQFLGRPLPASVALDPTLDIDSIVPGSAGLEELTLIAQQERQELMALELRAGALRRQADSVRGQSRPQLALTGGYVYMENEFLTDDNFWMAGVSFRWNLFDGGETRNRSAALDQKAIAVGHNRADLLSLIALQVRRAWNDRIETENRMAVAESAVAQATENLRVVRNRYQAGASANAEVLDAESLRVQSVSNRDDAHFEFALARLRLARAIGSL
jgi:outer membrane protein TolC